MSAAFSVTVEAFYQTTFKQMSFVPEELGIFLFLGIICGACAALFIYLHRQLVYFIRRNKVMKKLFQRNYQL
ncbi:hypothetical protein AB6A40_010925 [Gnathostoma spinigerum]|uniref:Uncharacterized protein n=1 Tax=Gnathostoma spinigerum TaxID=75299 RepID=A0ABD6EWE3_9BILA